MNQFTLTVRISKNHSHYSHDIVSNGTLMILFGDAITGLIGNLDHDESLLERWENAIFSQPIKPGDFISIQASIIKKTKLKRYIELIATRILKQSIDNSSSLSTCQDIVASAKAVTVIPYSAYKRNQSKEEK